MDPKIQKAIDEYGDAREVIGRIKGANPLTGDALTRPPHGAHSQTAAAKRKALEEAIEEAIDTARDPLPDEEG